MEIDIKTADPSNIDVPRVRELLEAEGYWVRKITVNGGPPFTELSR